MPSRPAATAAAVLLALAWVAAQGVAPSAPLIMVTREGRTPVPTTMVGTDEFIALDEVASLFTVGVREDTLAGGVRVTYRDRAIVATAGQSIASVNGRVITLPAPVTKMGTRWMVPVEFLPRALGQIYDRRIDLRRGARLLAVGEVRVVRVSARVESPGPPTRAVLDVVPGVLATVTTTGNQVQVRFDADVLDLVLPPAGAGLVTQIRAIDRAPVIQVGLADAAGVPRVTPTMTPERTRVVIEIPSASASVPPAPDTATPTPAPAAPASVRAPGVAPEASVPAPVSAGGVRTIAIDAGHGGGDSGATSADGLEEKALTLDVARRLRTLLESRLGLRVVMTRDDDRDVSPDVRTSAANAGRADLFISLHANGAFSPVAAGAEVSALIPDPATTSPAGDGTESVALPALGGSTRTVEFVRWEHAQARHVDRAWTIAAVIEEELRALVPMGSRPLRRTPLRTLAGANMPAVQVEMAYLTNPEQARDAAGDEFRNRIAQALFQSVARLVTGQESRTP